MPAHFVPLNEQPEAVVAQPARQQVRVSRTAHHAAHATCQARYAAHPARAGLSDHHVIIVGTSFSRYIFKFRLES